MNKKVVLIILLCFNNPLLYSGGTKSFGVRLRGKKITDFEQALAQLYTQKPELLRPQQPLEVSENISKDTWKNILTHSVNALPLLYFCYGTYDNYTNYVKINNTFHESYLHQMILSNFPGLFVNTPRHISFFLQETELLMQAYLFKLLLKMIIFCFG